MSSTITRTLSPERGFSSSERAISMTLHWKPLNYLKARDKLMDILERYESWQDPFSERLFRWGTEILPANLPDNYVPSEDELTYAAQKIDELGKEILVDPLYLKPLENPVLERQWLWEKWRLEDYRSLGVDKSPFDGKPLEEASPHYFAKDFIYWLRSLSNLASSSSEEFAESADLSLPSQNGSKEVNMLKMFTYMNLARSATLKDSMREGLRYPIEDASRVQAKLLQETRKMMRIEKELAKAKEEARDEALRSGLEEIKDTHGKERAILKDQLDDSSQRLTVTEKRAEKAEVTNAKHEVKIAQLEECKRQQAIELEKAKQDIKAAARRNNCQIL